jgi:eukaryotic-like serine/threonine-protein kinase
VENVPNNADPAGLAPGHTLLGRYRLVYRLRSAARGEVWRADDEQERRAVALQIVPVSGAHDRERVLDTLRLARTLTHPTLCQVFDVTEADGRIYCSLELLNGESLRTLVRRAGRLSSEKVAAIGRQLCEGMATLAAAGLHTTIDVSSVLLTERGAVRILDVGFPNESADPPTRAIAAILYELLTGTAPQGAMTGGKLAPVSAVVGGVDPQLERVITAALADDRATPPPSIADMANVLGGVVKQAPRDPYRHWMAAA